MKGLSMRFSAMSARDRRALALLAGAASLILLVRFIVFPVWDTAEDTARAIPVREKMLRKYRALADAVPQRENDSGGLENRLAEAEKGLLNSRTGPLAGAEVQQQLRDMANGAGIQMPSVGFLPLRRISPDYAVVPLSTQFTARVDQLAALLSGLHTGPKTLAVEQLRVLPIGEPAKKQVNVYLVVSGVTVAEAMKTEGSRQ